MANWFVSRKIIEGVDSERKKNKVLLSYWYEFGGGDLPMLQILYNFLNRTYQHSQHDGRFSACFSFTRLVGKLSI